MYKYTEEYRKKTEQRLNEELATLRRQLSSSNEGRTYEAEFIKEKLDLLKSTELVGHFTAFNATLQYKLNENIHTHHFPQKLKDYEGQEQNTEALLSRINDLEEEVGHLKVIESEYHVLQQEHADLSEQLSAQRSDDEHSLAQSDKDTITLLASLKVSGSFQGH